MTNPTPSPEVLPVEQVDRQAGVELMLNFGRPHRMIKDMEAGDYDGGHTIQAFARHRIATERAHMPASVDAGEVERLRRAWASACVESSWRLAETPNTIVTSHGRISVSWSVGASGVSREYDLAENTAALICEAVNALPRLLTALTPSDATRLTAERDAAREALTKCRNQFAFYVDAHMAKQPPDMDKAATNQEFVEMIDAALTRPTDGGEVVDVDPWEGEPADGPHEARLRSQREPRP